MCEGASEATTLDLVAAVGNLSGVEAVRFFCDLVFERTPDSFAIAAEKERVGEVVAIFVVGGPANGDGGTVFRGGERCGGRGIGGSAVGSE